MKPLRLPSSFWFVNEEGLGVEFRKLARAQKPFVMALAALLVGCNGADTSSATSTTSPAPASTAPATTPAPPAATTPAPTIQQSPIKKPVELTPKINTDPRTGMDPSRINQLKDLKVATIQANGHKIKVWLMDNESKRQEGMMFLEDKDVRANEGMLFVFPSLQPNDGSHGFWMHNCPLGLDICYIGANKKVINIADGKPFNDTSLPPGGDYQWVLEMKTNCAKKLGIKPGTPIQIPSGIKSASDLPR